MSVDRSVIRELEKIVGAEHVRTDPGDVAATQPTHGVAHRPGARELPAEERAVERHRRLGIGLQGVDPGGHSGLVVVALAHPLLLSGYPSR